MTLEAFLSALAVVSVLLAWLSGYFYGRADGRRVARMTFEELPKPREEIGD